MTESFPGEIFPSIEEQNKRSLKRTAISAVVGLSGVTLNRLGIEAIHIDDVLMCVGSIGTIYNGLSYAAGVVYRKLEAVEQPPRRTYGVIDKDSRNKIFDTIQNSSLNNHNKSN